MKKLTGSKSRFLVWVGLLFVLLTISNSCSKSSTSDTTSKPGANEVWIQGTSFNPTPITVAPGTTITWTNKDGIAHTVTSDNVLFDSSTINPNGTFSRQFPAVGTFNYHCTIHSSMLGKVIVQ